MKLGLYNAVSCLLLACVCSFMVPNALGNDRFSTEKRQFSKWLKKDHQKVPVIVRRLNDRQNRTIKLEDQLARHLVSRKQSKIRSFRDKNLKSLSVSESELDKLLSDSGLQVYPNRLFKVALNQSVPLVFSNQAASEFEGTDQKVVVIDTGVEAAHSFLSGAIDSSAAACFSNNGGAGLPGNIPASTSLCPNGNGEEISPTSAGACNSTIVGCNHGTQMAGIIAGNGAAQSGVATGAEIIPIQVFTQINDEFECDELGLPTPCIATTSADVLAALEYVAGLALNGTVAAVNISFGTSELFEGVCNSSVLEPSILQIVSAGTAVIASSGNNSSNLSMPEPACIPSVVSVASTNLLDAPSAFNNRNSTLDFFAPGEGINTSTLPANTFSDVQDVPSGGTSAAAAHVSGAWAVLKSKNPSTSVEVVKSALASTGVAITQGSANASRINITAALNEIEEPVINEDLCFPIIAQNNKIATICL